MDDYRNNGCSDPNFGPEHRSTRQLAGEAISLFFEPLGQVKPVVTEYFKPLIRAYDFVKDKV